MDQEQTVPMEESAALARELLAHAPYDGSFEFRLPGLGVSRVSRPYRELAHGVVKASLCLVAQGAKAIQVGPEELEYDASKLLVVSVDVPVAARVQRASPAEPYLCLRFDLDSRKIAELTPKVFPHGLPPVQTGPGAFVCQADPEIVRAATRLVGLMARAEDTELIAPLVVDEILVRLLLSPIGSRVAQLGLVESRLQRVSKAVSWVREHYQQPLDVERLAGLVHMSPSSFHQHFKSVTSMSPLQYQKVLRLQEARRLILSQRMDTGSASRQVGYLSPSQFSREYRRYFGHPPTRDLALLDGTQVRNDAS